MNIDLSQVTARSLNTADLTIDDEDFFIIHLSALAHELVLHLTTFVSLQKI